MNALLISLLGSPALADPPAPDPAEEASEPAPPGASAPAADPLVELAFGPETSLWNLVGFMGPVEGVNFVIGDPEALKKTRVTLIAPAPVTKDEAWQLFLGALRERGYRVERRGAIAKIVPIADGLPPVRPTLRTGAPAR